MDEVYSYLQELNIVSITLRFFLAALFGGIIGIERGRNGQAAGCRTHMIVCIASAMVMMTNMYIFNEISEASDPTRIGAQVVSGIGFLGAGTIIVTGKNKIRGLTTAAGLWASACMGLAIGVGYYKLAIIGNIFIFLIISFLNKFERYLYGVSKTIEIYIEGDSEVVKAIINYCRNKDISISNIQIIKNNNLDYNQVGVTCILKTKERVEHSQVISELSVIDNVSYIEEVS